MVDRADAVHVLVVVVQLAAAGHHHGDGRAVGAAGRRPGRRVQMAGQLADRRLRLALVHLVAGVSGSVGSDGHHRFAGRRVSLPLALTSLYCFIKI